MFGLRRCQKHLAVRWVQDAAVAPSHRIPIQGNRVPTGAPKRPLLVPWARHIWRRRSFAADAIGATRGVRRAPRRNSRSQSGRTRRWEPHVLLNVSTRSTNLHCLI